jgi:hypothetical protein
VEKTAINRRTPKSGSAFTGLGKGVSKKGLRFIRMRGENSDKSPYSKKWFGVYRVR